MKKTTINRILIGVITLMIFSICILIVCIATRPRYITTNEVETTVITEIPASADEPNNLSAASDNQSAAEAEEADSGSAALQGKTSTRVNIRNAPTEDGKVLDTVEEGTTFEIVEIQDNGWTKIIYDEQEAYISSSYVIIINN